MVVVRILWPAEASGGFMISSNGIGKTTIVRTLQIVQRENQWTLIVYSPSPRAPRSRSPVHTAGAGCSTGRTAGPLDKHQGQAAGYFGGSCLRSGGSSQAGRTVFAGSSLARSAPFSSMLRRLASSFLCSPALSTSAPAMLRERKPLRLSKKVKSRRNTTIQDCLNMKNPHLSQIQIRVFRQSRWAVC
jgi:hypothetical protein